MPENDFAKSPQEAQAKYEDFKNRDPFPEIQPALLNSADFEDYIRLTGMIWPYDKKYKKPATYGLRLLGTAIYWDKNKKRKKIEINENDKFILPSNSIAFVTLAEELRLP